MEELRSLGELRGRGVPQLENRDGRDFTVAATHEEAAVELAKDRIQSYRDLDTCFYQIGRKFRDDHARKGLIRAKEFTMMDAYSFHASHEDLEERYDGFLEAYRRVFDRLGLSYSVVAADNGSMGGTDSHEFIAESEAGSDTYMKCDSCEYGTKDLSVEVCDGCGASLRQVDGIEIGHCFDLGTRYSESMGLEFAREDGGLDHVLMASYGIGVSRVIAAVIEQNHDDRGIDWNSEVSAFDVSIVLAHHGDEARNEARRVHNELEESGLDVLLYDGQRSVGERFAESDLLGIGLKVVVGNTFLEDGELELETRSEETTRCSMRNLMVEVRKLI
nr:MAG: prolyl-tRNA synthetase [Candidatus Nanosalinarum sp. J07AB56]